MDALKKTSQTPYANLGCYKFNKQKRRTPDELYRTENNPNLPFSKDIPYDQKEKIAASVLLHVFLRTCNEKFRSQKAGTLKSSGLLTFVCDLLFAYIGFLILACDQFEDAP